VSSPPQRPQRRHFNEAILETGRPVHGLGDAFVRTIDAEANDVLDRARSDGMLTWPAFAPGWWRIVRRVVLGDGARDDEWITDALGRLRADANWGPFARRRDALRARFLSRLGEYVTRAEPGSLAGQVAAAHAEAGVDPVEQIPQWLFAFDAAGMASFRTLALLDAHSEAASRPREEAVTRDDQSADPLPFLRASVLESVRLWPTTPAILRDTTVETTWRTGVLPAGTGLVIFAPYFHRDGRRWPAADAFVPELWLDGAEAEAEAMLMPFSLGPAQCPGRHLVLLTTSLLLAAVLRRVEARQDHPRPLSDARPLPATLSPFRLRFALRRLSSGPQ
jgi:cytochrome P450